jgi:hypothetical protein
VTPGGQQQIPRPESFRIAGPPPWARLEIEERRLALDDVRRRLLRSPPGAAPTSLVPDSVAAAVLVPLLEVGGGFSCFRNALTCGACGSSGASFRNWFSALVVVSLSLTALAAVPYCSQIPASFGRCWVSTFHCVMALFKKPVAWVCSFVDWVCSCWACCCSCDVSALSIGSEPTPARSPVKVRLNGEADGPDCSSW